MKKAKIMLTAIIALSVVGGALAFKARSIAKVYVCPTTFGVAPTVTYLGSTTSPTGTPVYYTLTNTTCPSSNHTAFIPE